MERQSKNNTGHVFPYRWYLKDGYPAKGIEAHGLKVFGTFICGGGSSMGYKLAGYDHLGGVELDPSIAAIYKENHHPRFLFVEDIRDFNKREDLPEELYQLDILDGSPPCSTFSMAGSREKAWGKEKQFAEGQKLQRLDDLVFVYCDTIEKLQPKTFILENVSGLVKGAAKAYVGKIAKRCREAGYDIQLFLLNGASMGVPQRRERCFIIGRRQDLNLPPLTLSFHEPPITMREIIDYADTKITLSDMLLDLWKKRRPTDNKWASISGRVRKRASMFTMPIVKADEVCPTLTTVQASLYDIPRYISHAERLTISTFPQDYEDKEKNVFLTGMSVPPVMTAQISRQMFIQWFKKMKK